MIALGAAHGADIASTWGHSPETTEANPIFGPTFAGKRDVTLRISLAAGPMLAQYLVAKRYPNSRFVKVVLTRINFGMATGLGVVAARNWSLRR
jgi:hypothetical protein